MDAATYDAWYHTPRGSWIGEVEYHLLHRMLAPVPGATLLDVGCGTGYFTRRFAQDAGLRVTGLDPDRDGLAYARAHAGPNDVYIEGDARELPFPDASFDFVVSVTALCFIQDQRRAQRPGSSSGLLRTLCRGAHLSRLRAVSRCVLVPHREVDKSRQDPGVLAPNSAAAMRAKKA